MWSRQYRRRSVNNVLDEVEYLLKNYGIREFNFNDDLFTAKKSWFEEFYYGTVERKLDISYTCQTRVDTLNLDTLDYLKKTGCGKVVLGLASGSKKILGLMNKMINLEDVFAAVERIKKANMKVGASFVIGYYGETKETVKETVSFAKNLKLHHASFFQASPFPGTYFYDLLKKEKLLNEDMDWESYLVVSGSKPPFRLHDMEPDEINGAVKYALKKYYLSPSYIMMRLSEIRSYKQVFILLKGFIIFIRILFANDKK